ESALALPFADGCGGAADIDMAGMREVAPSEDADARVHVAGPEAARIVARGQVQLRDHRQRRQPSGLPEQANSAADLHVAESANVTGWFGLACEQIGADTQLEPLVDSVPRGERQASGP